MLCLIYQESVAIFKEKQYFQTKLGNFGITLNEAKLWRKADDLVSSLKLYQTIFCEPVKLTRLPLKKFNYHAALCPNRLPTPVIDASRLY